jgi:hypothetical protein
MIYIDFSFALPMKMYPFGGFGFHALNNLFGENLINILLSHLQVTRKVIQNPLKNKGL